MSANTIRKDFFKYTTLNIVGMLGISCYILADTFFVANGIGADGLAALNLAIPVYSFVHGCGLMLGVGGATKYTIAKSQGEHTRANQIFTTLFAVTGLAAVLFVLLGLFCSRPLTALLGADTALFEMTNTYLKVILLFAPFFLFDDLFAAFVRNDGEPGLAMAAMVAGSLFNIVMDYILIYPCGMGILGAVLATGMAPIVGMLILSLHKLQKKNQFHLLKFSLNKDHILGSMTLGFPSMVAEVSSGLVIIVFNWIVLNLAGNVGVAAYGIIANLAIVATSIYNGIAQGVQPLVSRAYGKQESSQIRSYLKYAIGTMLLLSAAVYAAVCLFPGDITALFNSEHNAQLQSIAEYGLILYFSSMFFIGFNMIISVFFTSTEHPIPAHIISLLRGLILIIPMAYLLANFFGLTGLWLAVPVTEALVCLLGILLWNRSRPYQDRSA